MAKFIGRLFPVKVGQVITVVGRSRNNAEKINFDLLSGTCGDDVDIQFHMSARFLPQDTSIVRNSRSKGDGKWGVEERSENILPFNTSSNPIVKGGIFKITIFVDQDALIVSIDEKPFCTFAHRVSITEIQKIRVSGDIDEVFQVNQKSAHPNPWPIVNTNIFEAFAPGQFNPGNVIVVTGMPRGNAGGNFTLKFYDGANKHRAHFQLQAYLDRNEVLVNSQNENGEFNEPKISRPLSPKFNIGEVFKLAVAITNSEFQVCINGERLFALPFREEIERLLGSLAGVEIVSNNGLNVQVQGVEFMMMGETCESFDRFTQLC